MISTKEDDQHALKRIQKELFMIDSNKIDGVEVTYDKNDTYRWHVAIKGPKNSPYVGGTFEYTFLFPKQYPMKPPTCQIQTGIYHPDYYGIVNSSVCLSSLQDNWSPSLSMRNIILEIQNGLLKPPLKNQFNPDAFNKFKNNRKEFDKIAKEWTKIYAMKYVWTKEKQTKMLQDSKIKKSYITKTFKSVNKFETKEVKQQKKKDEEYTKKILSKKPDGNASKRETLLHVIHAFAKSQGKNCLFSQDKKNKNSQFISGISDNKNQRATLVLDDLQGLVTNTTNSKHTNEESKTNDGETLKKEICVLKDAIKYQKKNKTIDNIKAKIAKSYNVDVKYVQINDIYYGSVHIDYNILTQLPNNGAVTDNLRREFQGFRDLNLHPLFFDFNFQVDDFDERGNKTFSSGTTYQVGPPNKKKGYIQPTGWQRFGLKVLDDRYNGTNEWLHPFQHNNNWYRAYHGTGWSSGNLILRDNGGNANERYAHFCPGPMQVHRNDIAEGGGTLGVGVYCSPSPTLAEGYAQSATIQTTQGAKNYKFMFQVCVDPSRIKISTSAPNYWVAPEGQPDCIRPYGILLKEH